jgi:hypothetical protein
MEGENKMTKDKNKVKIIFFVSVIFIIISVLIENLNSILVLFLMSISAFWLVYSNGVLVILEDIENKKRHGVRNKLISKIGED